MKRNHKVLALILVIALMSTLLLGCGSNAKKSISGNVNEAAEELAGIKENEDRGGKGPIYVALLAPFTGNFAQYGEGYKAAIELKFKEYNDAGGYNGRMLVLEVFDDKASAQEGITAAQKIVNDDRFVICLGPWASAVGLAVGDMFADAGMGLYGISCSAMTFVEQNDFIIRGTPNIEVLDWTDARLSYEEYGCRTACYMHYLDDAANQSAELFKKSFETLGGEVLSIETFASGDVDYSAQLTNIIALNPDVIHVFASYAECAKIIIQARELGYDGRIAFSGSAYNQELINLTGDYSEGCTVVQIDPNQPEAKQLLADYKEYAGMEMNGHAYLAYEAASHLCQAIDKVGVNRLEVVEFMRNNKHCQTIFGEIDFTNGEPNAFRWPLIIKDGEFISIDLKNTTLEDLLKPIEYR